MYEKILTIKKTDKKKSVLVLSIKKKKNRNRNRENNNDNGGGIGMGFVNALSSFGRLPVALNPSFFFFN